MCLTEFRGDVGQEVRSISRKCHRLLIYQFLEKLLILIDVRIYNVVEYMIYYSNSYECFPNYQFLPINVSSVSAFFQFKSSSSS